MGLLLQPREHDGVEQRPSFANFLLEPKIGKGNQSIPLQAESHQWLKYLILIPLSTFTSMVFFAYFWLPLLEEQGIFRYAQTFL